MVVQQGNACSEYGFACPSAKPKISTRGTVLCASPSRTLKDIHLRLDAVEDLMNNPAFEEEFTALAKGLPDLERIVSRIHAKSCKIKDFLHALNVSSRGI